MSVGLLYIDFLPDVSDFLPDVSSLSVDTLGAIYIVYELAMKIF